jgi:glycosyltransferase involved in cell wall biosynthesis
MKIVVLGTRGFPDIQGGVEKHCENLYPRLVEKGCEVVVLGRRPYVGDKDYTYGGVKIVSVPCLKHRDFEAFFHTLYGVCLAKRMGCDILHIHAVGPSLFVLFARLLGLKVVMTHHGPDYLRRKWGGFARLILRLGELIGVTQANQVIVVSRTVADDIKKKYRRAVTFIPNGVILPETVTTEAALKEHGLEKGKYVLTVGRFVPEKGFCDLIEGFVRAQAADDPSGDPPLEGWKLAIVGRADFENRYSLRIQDESRDNPNIVLTGFLSSRPLQEVYSHAGLFVLPSYYEGLPIVLLEAMSYGLSCIASDIPANRNVESLAGDRFFAPGDTRELSLKIREFIGRPFTEEERKLQVNTITRRYNWDNIADEVLEVYEEVLKRR